MSGSHTLIWISFYSQYDTIIHFLHVLFGPIDEPVPVGPQKSIIRIFVIIWDLIKYILQLEVYFRPRSIMRVCERSLKFLLNL